MSEWLAEADTLRRELAANPGRLAFAVDDDLAADNAEALAAAWRTSRVQVGTMLTVTEDPPSPDDILPRLAQGSVFVDTEILFWQDLKLDPVGLFRQLARTAPRVFLWPGTITKDVASFSRPGRSDHYEAKISNAIVLRALVPRFPDELPYRTERIP